MSTLTKRLGALIGAGALVVALTACSAGSATGDTVADGVLTIATGEPA